MRPAVCLDLTTLFPPTCRYLVLDLQSGSRMLHNRVARPDLRCDQKPAGQTWTTARPEASATLPPLSALLVAMDAPGRQHLQKRLIPPLAAGAEDADTAWVRWAMSALPRCQGRFLMTFFRTGRAPFVTHPALQKPWCSREVSTRQAGTASPGSHPGETAPYCRPVEPSGVEYCDTGSVGRAASSPRFWGTSCAATATLGPPRARCTCM